MHNLNFELFLIYLFVITVLVRTLTKTTLKIKIHSFIQKYLGFRSNFRLRVYMLKEPLRAERVQRRFEDSISKIEDSI